MENSNQVEKSPILFSSPFCPIPFNTHFAWQAERQQGQFQKFSPFMFCNDLCAVLLIIELILL